MTHPEDERIRPVTAKELTELHPYVDVVRDVFGSIVVSAALYGDTPYHNSSTYINMSSFPGRNPGSALRIAGKPKTGGKFTDIRIPLFGALDEMKIVERARSLQAIKVIEMATDGIRLFDDARNLPEEERRLLESLPGGNQKVYDYFRFVEPEVTPENISSIPPGHLMYCAFGVARRLLRIEAEI